MLLVDEALCANIVHPLLEEPFGWDVGDVLKGKRTLKDSLVSISGVTIMPADTEHLDRSLEAARIQLIDSFYTLAIGFDCVVIHAASDLQRHGIGFALAASEMIVLCDESDHGITQAYRHIKTLKRILHVCSRPIDWRLRTHWKCS